MKPTHDYHTPLRKVGLRYLLRLAIVLNAFTFPLVLSAQYAPPAPFSFTSLYSFTNGSDGSESWAPLALGIDSNFYGTTFYGGSNGAGTVFKISPAGALTPLHSFTAGLDGGFTQAGLVQGTDGNFYGVTGYGGSSGYGVIFKISSSGVLTPLYSFTNGIDGSSPQAALVQGTDGSFYGTAAEGGANGNGTIFKIESSGAFAPLYSFTGSVDGSTPNATLIQAQDGNFYGTTPYGGSNDFGAVFKFAPSGALTPLYSFTNGVDGCYPWYSALIEGPDAAFYGVTQRGGTNGSGSVFRITTNGALTPCYSFTNGVDGALPSAGLAQGSDGYFYGTTGYGGPYTNGTAFRITMFGALNTLYAFTNGIDGASPHACFTSSGSDLYSTAPSGGTNADGTVFKITPPSTPPTITVEPQSQTNGYGATVIYSVTATGTAPCSYQWFFNGAPLANSLGLNGAQSNVLTIGDALSDKAGNYSLLITNAYGTASSAAVTLTLTNVSWPVIYIQATNQLLLAGNNATLTVGASGVAPLEYEWLFNGTNLSDGWNIAGSSSNILTLTGVTTNQAGSYEVIVSNAYGTATDSVSMTVLQPAPPQDFTYTLNDAGFTITGYTGSGGVVVVPASISGLPVISIGSNAFINSFGLDSLTIPGSVRNIEYGAFAYCENLTNLTILGSITNFGDNAFQDCSGLTSVTVPSSVRNIGSFAFEGCGLANLTIPNGVNSIGEFAFAACGLTGVTIPASVASIGGAAFSDDGLNAITVDEQNAFYSSTNGVLFDKSQTTLIEYPAGLDGSYLIPGSVVGIGVYAFYDCALTNVTIPNSVTSIGDCAFEYCGLTRIDIPLSVTNIGRAAFQSCYNVTSLVIPISATNIGYSAFADCDALTNVTIPNGVTGLAFEEFAFCQSLTSITVPASVINVGTYAFFDCYHLTTVLFTGDAPDPDYSTFNGDNVVIYYLVGASGWGSTFDGFQTVPDLAATFSYTTNASTVTITRYLGGDGGSLIIPSAINGLPVASLGSYAFAGSGLSSVTIPAGVTNIGSGAFYNCAELTAVYCAGNAPAADSSAFASDNNTMVYYAPGTAGWGSSFAGLPAHPVTLLWIPPAAITEGTPLTSSQLDATANVPGTVIYTPPEGTVFNAGPNTLMAVFTAANAFDTLSLTTTVALLVLPAPPPTNNALTVTPIYSFTESLGANPSSLLTGEDGRLYGSLSSGGTNESGAVFCLTTNGFLDWSFSFDGTNGSSPAGLIQGVDGNLYGVATSGGSNGYGAAFSITTNGALRWSWAFTGYNGASPNSLLQGFDGNLYGTTHGGGTDFGYYYQGLGTVFSLNTEGDLIWSFDFNGTDGNLPNSPLIQGRDGQLYDTSGDGYTAFSLNTNGDTNWSVSVPRGGYGTLIGLTQGKDGNLYGSGQMNDQASIFSLTTTGGSNWSLSIPVYGNIPTALIQGSNGNLYTLLSQSGLVCAATNGSLLWETSLAEWSSSGSLIQIGDQSILGASADYNKGLLFAVSTNGNLLWSYSLASLPAGELVRGADGAVYGVTSDGGSEGDGALFRISGSIAPPSVITQPSGSFVLSGTSVELTSDASGSGPISYQWQFDGTNLSDNAIIIGSQSNILTLTGLALSNSGSYLVVISNPYGSVTSTVANLTVLPAPANDHYADASTLGEEVFFGYSIGEDEWWSWTAPNSGLACVVTDGSSFYPEVGIYTGDSVSNLALVTNSAQTYYNDPSSTPNYLTFPAVGGTTYYISVGGGNDNFPNNISISVQPEGISISNFQKSLYYDATEFSASIEVANCGSSPQDMEIDVVAMPGYSSTQSYYYSDYPNKPLGSYYIVNLAPGAQTNFIISNTCPAPIIVDSQNFGVGYDVFVNFTGTYNDSIFLFSGQWPVISGFNGPGGGVVRVDPSANGGGPYQLLYATINGPNAVSANSTANYSGIVNLYNGSGTKEVGFSATEWTVNPDSGCTISSNGVLSTGMVGKNTNITITAYYIFGTTMSVSTTVSLVAPPVPTLTLTSGANPSSYGIPITFTASLQTNNQAIAGAAGESVAFYSGGGQIGAGTLNSSGQASYTTLPGQLPAGISFIAAVYGGDASYSACSNSPSLAQTVNQLPVSLSITANNKVYDGTTKATLSTNSAMLFGVLNGDAVSLNTDGYTANFASTGAANAIDVAVSGLTLTGASAANYYLVEPTNLAASITAAPVTIGSGLIANNKVYDGTSTATLAFNTVGLLGVIGSDVVSLDTNGYMANFASAEVGNGIDVTVAGLTLTGVGAANYSLVEPTNLTANITGGAGGVNLQAIASLPNIIISWPVGATGLVLEQTTSLVPPVTWLPVTNSITVSGTNNTVIVSASFGENYFVLMASP